MKHLWLILCTLTAITRCGDKPVPTNYDLLYIESLTTGQLKQAEELLHTGKATADCSTLIMFGSIVGVSELLRRYGAFKNCNANHLQQLAFFLQNEVLFLPEQRTAAIDVAQEILAQDRCVHPIRAKSGNPLVDELNNENVDEQRFKELLVAAHERAKAAQAHIHVFEYWCP